MKKFLPKILFFYCGIASLFITLSTVLVATNTLPVIFVILFLPVTSYFLVTFLQEDPEIDVIPRSSEIIVSLIIFIILFAIGLKNILPKLSQPASSAPAAVSPLIFKTLSSPQPNMLTVKITDGSHNANVYTSPDVTSEKLTELKNGQKIEEISKNGDWYQIKINDITGYISMNYIAQ